MALSARVAACILVAGCAGSAPGTGSTVVVVIPPPLPAPAETAAREAPAPSDVLGHWEGLGEQDSGAAWRMEVEIRSLKPGVCGRVRYPGIPCAGEWICSDPSDGKRLHARERLTEHRENCIDDGEMTMQLTPDGALEWTWTGGGDRARATLRRGKKRSP